MAKPSEFLRIFSDLKCSIETALIDGVEDINGIHDLEVTRDAMLDLVLKTTAFIETSKKSSDPSDTVLPKTVPSPAEEA